ncbi:MAG: GNAT family N-acetyltransferase [Candidatus Binatia bacterium]
MKVEVCNGLCNIEPAVWNSLVGDASPFLEWEWLASLEDAGCVGPATGWLPQHLTLWEGGRLIGACPLYVKAHSQGEFVFDHDWAAAAARGGIPYYPKLLVAVPFTPATGARFLAHPRAQRSTVIQSLGGVLREICSRSGFSSVHINFCLPDEVEQLAALGFERRASYQFQWVNPGWQTFDDYLAAFRSKRRGQIKRERRELAAQSVDITVYAGNDIPDALFAPMFRLYKSTIDKLYWGRQYLNAEFFDLLRRRWKQRLCFFIARQRGEVVAGTLTVHKANVLYGRYWGTLAELRYLHFNVCYYASVEYCLQHGIARFEPGAGGQFKHLRGFDARPTESMHFVADSRLAHAVRRYLKEERAAVAREIDWLGAQSALKRPA